MSSNAVFKGDDTAAFGNNFITITIRNPNKFPVSKIEAATNSGCCIPNKPFTDPGMFQTETITLYVNYSSDESAQLNQGANTLNLVVFDELGRQRTCPQTLVFYAQNGVILRNGQSCC